MWISDWAMAGVVGLFSPHVTDDTSHHMTSTNLISLCAHLKLSVTITRWSHFNTYFHTWSKFTTNHVLHLYEDLTSYAGAKSQKHQQLPFKELVLTRNSGASP